MGRFDIGTAMRTKFKIGELVGRKHDTAIGMVWRVHKSPSGFSYYVRWSDGFQNWWADVQLVKI